MKFLIINPYPLTKLKIRTLKRHPYNCSHLTFRKTCFLSTGSSYCATNKWQNIPVKIYHHYSWNSETFTVLLQEFMKNKLNLKNIKYFCSGCVKKMQSCDPIKLFDHRHNITSTISHKLLLFNKIILQLPHDRSKFILRLSRIWPNVKCYDILYLIIIWATQITLI